MNWRTAAVWFACAGVALGLGVAWIEGVFGIPKPWMQIGWLVVGGLTFAFALWTGIRLLRELSEGDD